MYNKQYLAKRPFMVITASYKPAPGARTEKAGWSEVSGWEVNEQLSLVDRVTHKHLVNATVIVDVLEASIVVNRLRGASDEEALQHFMTKYKDQVSQALGIWMEGEARKRASTLTVDPVAEAVTEVTETTVENETA